MAGNSFQTEQVSYCQCVFTSQIHFEVLGGHLIPKHQQKLVKRLSFSLSLQGAVGDEAVAFLPALSAQALQECPDIAPAIAVRWFCVWTCAGLCHLQLPPPSRLWEEEVVAGAGWTE